MMPREVLDKYTVAVVKLMAEYRDKLKTMSPYALDLESKKWAFSRWRNEALEAEHARRAGGGQRVLVSGVSRWAVIARGGLDV